MPDEQINKLAQMMAELEQEGSYSPPARKAPGGNPAASVPYVMTPEEEARLFPGGVPAAGSAEFEAELSRARMAGHGTDSIRGQQAQGQMLGAYGADLDTGELLDMSTMYRPDAAMRARNDARDAAARRSRQPVDYDQLLSGAPRVGVEGLAADPRSPARLSLDEGLGRDNADIMARELYGRAQARKRRAPRQQRLSDIIARGVPGVQDDIF